MADKKTFYLTTAIAYTSGKPHIGNTYEAVLADSIVRYKRLEGYDVRFQTGTDEHGQKIELKAEEAGVTPKQFVDDVSGQIKTIWDLMNTSYDKFIRTTDDYHEKQVQKIFKKLYEQGDIYKGFYEGMYCTPCESFFTSSQLVDGKCLKKQRKLHVSVLLFMAAALVTLEKSAKGGMQKFFKYVPAVVLCYLIAMLLCTLGVWDMAETKPAYSALKNNLTYAMIFAMLLRCNIRKVLKLGPKMLIGFFSATLTIMIGFVCAFVLMKGTIGSDVWMGLCALCGSWIGGSGNMVAMQDALPVDPGAYACALTLNTVCYSVWIALLIFMVRYSSKWDKSVKADTSKLSAIADVANEEVEKEKKAKATSGDWVWMIGLALIVSALSQWVGAKMGAGFAGMGLKMFDKGTCTTLFVTVLGLACAMTPLGKLPAANELSSVLLYAVVALLATQAPLNALIEAPMWVVYGVFILVLHVVGMYILSKLFHWDLCMVSTASVANIGGPASAPIIAVAYNPNYAGIGVLMGIFGQAIGNFFGLGMGWLLNLMA